MKKRKRDKNDWFKVTKCAGLKEGECLLLSLAERRPHEDTDAWIKRMVRERRVVKVVNIGPASGEERP